MSKKFWRSKTVWAMGLAFASSLITGITGESWLDGDAQIAVLSFAGMVLRWKTDTRVVK